MYKHERAVGPSLLRDRRLLRNLLSKELLALELHSRVALLKNEFRYLS